jgi:transcriptional antiterminator RfaH
MNAFNANWYVIYTKPRYEKKVAQQLGHLNLQHFLPIIRTLRVWAGKKKYIHIPLFPSYVFVRIESRQQYFESLQITGVLNYVRIGNKVEAVSEKLINNLRGIITNDKHDIEVSQEYFKPGNTININSGPFAGHACEVIQHKGKRKILVRIELLQRNILLDLPVGELVNCVPN